jgi:hypothetical protein
MKLFPIASYRKWLLGVTVFVAVAWGWAYEMSQKIDCAQGTISCNNYINILDGFVRGPFILSVIISALFLLFFPERAFKWWRWFAIISIPILVWWITTSIGEFFGPQSASLFSGVFFAVMTILIAISAAAYNHLKLRGGK